jgi:hypothetical protein
MQAKLEPIINDLRAIYNLEGAMVRYWSYVDLMTKRRHEQLPLGDFSPMGKRQADFLDKLIALGAEDIASEVCLGVCEELSSDAIFRVMLVIVDEPKNGWTQRFLTDADWRFSKPRELSKKSQPKDFDRWVTVQLWTTDIDLEPLLPTPSHVRQKTRAAIFRAYWQQRQGYPSTLSEMIRQEGSVMKFSGETLSVDQNALYSIKQVVTPLLDSIDFPTNFAAFYGDEAAISVGYEPLGLPPQAGFLLSLAEANLT